MIATGDPVLKAIVTNGKKVVGVVHMRRRPNAYQKSALDWLFPTCAAKGCGTRACFLQTDHREDWAHTHITVLELLDRLCRYHHRLKTTKGWALVEGTGKRDFVPPHDPRHPRHATARSARVGGAGDISGRAAAIVGEGSWSAMLPARVPAAIEAGPARARKARSCYAPTEPHYGLSLALAVSRGAALPANQHRSAGRYGTRLPQDRCFGVATDPRVMVEHCPRPRLVDRAHTGSGAHPLTAPANRPRTRCFCSKKNMSAMGIMVNSEAPNLRGNWLPEDRPPFTRFARPVVSV